MPTKDEFIVLGAIVLLVFAFFTGYHLRGVVDVARQVKEEKADITDANQKLKDNNTTDTTYNRQVAIIEEFADKTNQEVANETDSHNCPIPDNWLRILQANSSR